MIWYIKCSCSKVISINLDKYYDDYDAILNDPKISKDEKDKLASELLDKYGYRRYCCRSKMLGMIPVPYHKIINS